MVRATLKIESCVTLQWCHDSNWQPEQDSWCGSIVDIPVPFQFGRPPEPYYALGGPPTVLYCKASRG